jgi:hypothetical protein
MPTTYEAPSAASATPSETSLPLPPQVVSDNSVWACAVADGKVTHSNPAHANNSTSIAEQAFAAEDVTHFGLLIGNRFFIVIDSHLFVGASLTSD